MNATAVGMSAASSIEREFEAAARAHQEGRLGEAVTLYLQVLEREPGYAPGHLALARALRAQGLIEAALMALQNVIALTGPTADVWLEMAAVYESRGELMQASAALERVLAHAPQDTALRYRAALLARDSGNVATARHHLDYVVQHNPAQGAAWIALGNLHETQGDPGAARRCFERAGRTQPPHPDAALNLALLDAPSPAPLYLALPRGNSSGWGVCGRYLTAELAQLTPVVSVDFQDGPANAGKRIPGTLFGAIADVSLAPTIDLCGRRTVGYTFFENELTPRSAANAKRYDLILAGSSWCVERLREAGIQHTDLLIQGIDPAIFHPAPARVEDGRFVIFSGGKFELRKGQDLVLRAVAILQQKYPDVVLVTSWFNHWPRSMETMAASTHIRYEHRGANWDEVMTHLYRLNGLDPARVITHGVRPNDSLREVYAASDVGLFPNRCEGGTNLVLMEYMACGRPVVASYATGHTDVLTRDNALLLERLRPYHLRDPQQNLVARWEEPDLDEMVASLEYAYRHRDTLRALGARAGADMARFTWRAAAECLHRFLRAG
jgi:glycosyltransferase involved in cell wall biosynthesis